MIRSLQLTRPGFLAVDRYLESLVDARALKSAFELGLIAHLYAHDHLSLQELPARLACDQAGLQLLLGLLAANGVVAHEGFHADSAVRLTEQFRQVLLYQDLLEVKLNFAGILLNDFADLFTTLLRDPDQFAGSSRLFQLFDYRLALSDTGDNYARTRSWMQLTSTLTRYEAGACLDHHDFRNYRQLLDVGGNSGEFLLQICRRHPQLRGTVADLPLVCEIGLEHVLSEPEHKRMAFLPMDLRRDSLPDGFDCISFKSMLHDWPEESALGFLNKAAAALTPGGTLLIFERLPIVIDKQVPGFGHLPILLFFRSYRDPRIYLSHLETLGFIDIVCTDIELDTPFALISARKPHTGLSSE